VRKAVVIAAIATGLTGCGGSATVTGHLPIHTPIQFGIAGGNIAPYQVTIQPNGSVRITGSGRKSRRHITSARVRNLQREIEQAHLASRRCPGVLPDVAGQYIRLGDRMVTVHGTCEQGFQRVWNDLLRRVALVRSG
jgi:hypothetical protein